MESMAVICQIDWEAEWTVGKPEGGGIKGIKGLDLSLNLRLW